MINIQAWYCNAVLLDTGSGHAHSGRSIQCDQERITFNAKRRNGSDQPARDKILIHVRHRFGNQRIHEKTVFAQDEIHAAERTDRIAVGTLMGHQQNPPLAAKLFKTVLYLGKSDVIAHFLPVPESVKGPCRLPQGSYRGQNEAPAYISGSHAWKHCAGYPGGACSEP